MHVYRMQQLIKRRGEDEVINVTQPNSLYQTIARLEREGLLVAGSVDRDSKRPERTVYELTDSGKATLVTWTREMLSAPSREFPEFPAAISVLLVLTPEGARSSSWRNELRGSSLKLPVSSHGQQRPISFHDCSGSKLSCFTRRPRLNCGGFRPSPMICARDASPGTRPG